MLRALGAVQLDTISVLARSHELVAYARLGAIGRTAIEEAYWNRSSAVEYWSHAACLLPIEAWPLYAFRRRHHVRRGCRWSDAPSPAALAAVRRQLAAEGPMTVTDAGGARRAAGWWQWSEVKNALEWLLVIGDVVCTRRVGWRRVYDLAERALPAFDTSGWVEADGVWGPSDAACLTSLTAIAGASLGIGTLGDLADVPRITRREVQAHLAGTDLVRVQVDGWSESTWADPRALNAALNTEVASRAVSSRTVLLSPFDSLIWNRARTERLFGVVHRLEAYTPAQQRVHGYFAMPVLHAGQLVARVDPKRVGRALVAATVTFEAPDAPTSEQVDGTARAIVEAASWVNAERIDIGTVVPSTETSSLRNAVVSAADSRTGMMVT